MDFLSVQNWIPGRMLIGRHSSICICTSHLVRSIRHQTRFGVHGRSEDAVSVLYAELSHGRRSADRNRFHDQDDGTSIRELYSRVRPGLGQFDHRARAKWAIDVTALDIDPNFARLINERAALLGLKVDSRVGKFSDTGRYRNSNTTPSYSYQCFHHCSDDVNCSRICTGYQALGGHVFLCAEPILESFHAPWGVRLDGESLWAARENGWLELGFTESYFVETCARRVGTSADSRLNVSPLATIWRLSQFDGLILPGQTRLPLAGREGWARTGLPGPRRSAIRRLVAASFAPYPARGPRCQSTLSTQDSRHAAVCRPTWARGAARRDKESVDTDAHVSLRRTGRRHHLRDAELGSRQFQFGVQRTPARLDRCDPS